MYQVYRLGDSMFWKWQFSPKVWKFNAVPINTEIGLCGEHEDMFPNKVQSTRPRTLGHFRSTRWKDFRRQLSPRIGNFTEYKPGRSWDKDRDMANGRGKHIQKWPVGMCALDRCRRWNCRAEGKDGSCQ